MLGTSAQGPSGLPVWHSLDMWAPNTLAEDFKNKCLVSRTEWPSFLKLSPRSQHSITSILMYCFKSQNGPPRFKEGGIRYHFFIVEEQKGRKWKTSFLS